MKKLLIALFLLIPFGLLIWFFTITKNSASTQHIVTPSIKNGTAPKRIVGFLPYWQMDAIDNLHFDLLSEVIFFGLHIDEHGQILKEDSGRLGTDLFKKLQELANQQTKITVVLALQDNEKIETFLKDSSNWQKVSDGLLPLIKTHKLSGVNVDFEYSGIPAKETVASYASFVQILRDNLKKESPNLLVTVDVTADAIKKSRLYDVEKLAKVADYIVLMGYDFYRPSSSVAGPPAPLLGKEIYEYDITSAVSDFLSFVPREKLLLGVPYYGWDFPTAGEERGSPVEKREGESVAFSSYKRNRKLISEKNLTVRFDQESQTPWMVYLDPQTQKTRQVWFENEVSLGKKYDLVNKESLAGIAIWALGYDGDSADLWNLLAKKFRD